MIKISNDDINSIDILLKILDINFLSDLYYDNFQLSQEIRSYLDKQVSYFPLDIQDNTLGKPLENITVKEGNVTSVKFTHKNKEIDFIEKQNDELKREC